MTAPNTLQRLEGEPEIPGLTPRRNPNSHKPIVAAAVLMLSLMGALGFAATRYFAKKATPAEATMDVASATVSKLRFQEPPAGGSAAPAPVRVIASTDQTRVPSIEAEATAPATAIPLRSQAGGRPAKVAVPVGDESPFGPAGSERSDRTERAALPDRYDGGALAPQRLGGTDPLPTAGPAGLAVEAQANLRRYQNQLGAMLGQLQGLTDKAAGADKTTAADLAPAMAMAMVGGSNGNGNASGRVNPPLFGSMERSATPTVVAGLLGNRSLTLPRGVLFTCSLKTRVVSATSGFVACQVQRNVFSDDGKVVLAERGSHLDGEYRVVHLRPGVTRIPVLWTRLRTPHGVTVDLDSPGTGALGESGIGGHVDNRWPERIGAAMLLSLIDDAVKIAVSDASATNGLSGSSTVLLPSTTAASSKLAEKVLEATINIPPLLYQNQGSVVGVYVARDVDFSKVYALEPR